MKVFKSIKKSIGFFAVISVISVFANIIATPMNVFAAEEKSSVSETTYVTYKFAPINTYIDVPKDFITFTRKVSSADPNLSKIGASAEQLRTLMESSDAYMETMPKDMSYEIVLSGKKGINSRNLNELSKDELSEFKENYTKQLNSAESDTIFKVDTYSTGENVYLVADFKTTSDTTVYSRKYYTIQEGCEITIALQTKLPSAGDPNDSTTYIFDENVASNLKTIVDKMHYEPMKASITDSSIFNELMGYIFGIVVTIGGLGLILFLMIQSTKKPKKKN